MCVIRECIYLHTIQLFKKFQQLDNESGCEKWFKRNIPKNVNDCIKYFLALYTIEGFCFRKVQMVILN
jgi:hypothetical protein